jgi:surface polysaccharide O-acyltransferase-like enzyme
MATPWPRSEFSILAISYNAGSEHLHSNTISISCWSRTVSSYSRAAVPLYTLISGSVSHALQRNCCPMHVHICACVAFAATHAANIMHPK